MKPIHSGEREALARMRGGPVFPVLGRRKSLEALVEAGFARKLPGGAYELTSAGEARLARIEGHRAARAARPRPEDRILARLRRLPPGQRLDLREEERVHARRLQDQGIARLGGGELFRPAFAVLIET